MEGDGFLMRVSRPRFALLPLIALAWLTTGLFVTASTAQEATPVSTATGDVTREVLNAGYPEVAPGTELALTRVVIPAGAIVPPHFHPGLQLIYVESGTVHYTVVSGELPYTKAGTDGAAGIEGIQGPGEEMEFGPGDRFVEFPGMVHSAVNRGDGPAVVLAASLFQDALPSTIPIEID